MRPLIVSDAQNEGIVKRRRFSRNSLDEDTASLVQIDGPLFDRGYLESIPSNSKLCVEVIQQHFKEQGIFYISFSSFTRAIIYNKIKIKYYFFQKKIN